MIGLEMKKIMDEFKDKTYLGDSVYAQFDGERIWIITENGLGYAPNKICLEPEVLESLDRYRYRKFINDKYYSRTKDNDNQA